MVFGVDIPTVPLVFGGFAPQGLHVITHNPFSIIVILAPGTMLLAKLTELARRGVLRVLFADAEWIKYSLAQTYLSAMFGAFLHLGWELTMHQDVDLGFPCFCVQNPFISGQASFSRST